MNLSKALFKLEFSLKKRLWIKPLGKFVLTSNSNTCIGKDFVTINFAVTTIEGSTKPIQAIISEIEVIESLDNKFLFEGDIVELHGFKTTYLDVPIYHVFKISNYVPSTTIANTFFPNINLNLNGTQLRH